MEKARKKEKHKSILTSVILRNERVEEGGVTGYYMPNNRWTKGKKVPSNIGLGCSTELGNYADPVAHLFTRDFAGSLLD